MAISGQPMHEQRDSVMPERVDRWTEHIIIDVRCSVRAASVRRAAVVQAAHVGCHPQPTIEIVSRRSIEAVHVEGAPTEIEMQILIATEHFQLRRILGYG